MYICIFDLTWLVILRKSQVESSQVKSPLIQKISKSSQVKSSFIQKISKSSQVKSSQVKKWLDLTWFKWKMTWLVHLWIYYVSNRADRVQEFPTRWISMPNRYFRKWEINVDIDLFQKKIIIVIIVVNVCSIQEICIDEKVL